MRVACGFKAHSGWAALVVVGTSGEGLELIDRRRVDLVDEAWAKAPYHAAEELGASKADNLVQRALERARRGALREMHAVAERTRSAGHELVACAVLMPAPMPDWSVAEILAVHFRMHKAEGVIVPRMLARAAEECGLRLAQVPEKELDARSARLGAIAKSVATFGKRAGPPWAKDQRSAALAALIALRAS
jgi:hypothetical protein